MNTAEAGKLRFRRQYLLAPENLSCPFEHNITRLPGGYTLYAHTDLVVTTLQKGKVHLCMLGDMFDYRDPIKSNADILQDLAGLELSSFLEENAMYSGRYVLIRTEHQQCAILHDATAARKVFYARQNGKYYFSSQQHLLARVLGLEATSEEAKLAYYRSAEFLELSNANLGNLCYYDEVLQLMPNHYFDLRLERAFRYWPTKNLPVLRLEEAREICTPIIHGTMESIRARYKLMLPVTAGGDSRLLMAATKDFGDDVYYYINKSARMHAQHKDIRVPEKLLARVGREFHILDMPGEVDPDFRRIYFENNPLAPEEFLAPIYNYYLHFGDRVNLPGNIASTPWGVYDLSRKRVKIREILSFYEIQNFEFIRSYYDDWMEKLQAPCRECNLNVVNVFYWEERMANWGNQVGLDKDIAQEDINPFNARYLNEVYLSVPLRYNNEPDKLLHQAIIKSLWPELMHMPFNPSKRTSMMNFLARLGIFTPVSRTLYKLGLKKFFS